MNESYRAIFDRRGHHYNAAMQKYPQAREQERAALLALAQLEHAKRIVDAPAGGGFVAAGLVNMVSGDCRIECIEPSLRFAAPMQSATESTLNLRAEELDGTSLPDSSQDVVFSLAGLHHFDDKLPVYREWVRILKHGGQLCLADIMAGTGSAQFLNGFVDQHTPGGHRGIFLDPETLTKELALAGLTQIEWHLIDVPWVFGSENDMIDFCRELFTLPQADAREILAALHDQVSVSQHQNQSCALHWQLLYCTARKSSSA